MSEGSRVSTRKLSLLLAALAAIGPFSIDAYLPSIADIGESFSVSNLVVQQTLTAYMVPFALMTLWQGAISDSLGRRKVVLIAQFLFFLASIGSLLSWSIHSLMVFRALQGMSAGAGMVVGRAVVRDLLDGAEARKLMAKVAIVFAIAPALGPVIGGWLQVWFGWRSVFVFLLAYSFLLIVWCWRSFPETLPVDQRQSLHPFHLVKGYVGVFQRIPFVMLVLSVTLNFSAIFVYIMSAPVFLIQHLGLKETDYLWLFGPVTLGMFIGTWLAGRAAASMGDVRTLFFAYALMLGSALINLVFHSICPPSLPWTVVPLVVYVMGSSLAMPTLTIMAIDLFLKRKGMASSCQSFVQSLGSALVTGLVAPFAWVSVERLAWVQVVFAGLAFAVFVGYLWYGRRVPRSTASEFVDSTR